MFVGESEWGHGNVLFVQVFACLLSILFGQVRRSNFFRGGGGQHVEMQNDS